MQITMETKMVIDGVTVVDKEIKLEDGDIATLYPSAVTNIETLEKILKKALAERLAA